MLWPCAAEIGRAARRRPLRCVIVRSTVSDPGEFLEVYVGKRAGWIEVRGLPLIHDETVDEWGTLVRGYFMTGPPAPGGGGSTSGTINSLCAVHDACFSQAGLDTSVNVGTSGSSLTSIQVAAAKGCNQALYEGARRHPDAPGSTALQWWLTQGGKTKPFVGFYILYPGTAAKP